MMAEPAADAVDVGTETVVRIIAAATAATVRVVSILGLRIFWSLLKSVGWKIFASAANS